MLTRRAKEVIGDYLAEAQTSWKAVSDYYETANPSLQPAITLTVNGGNLEFLVSYIVDYTKRTVAQDQLFTKIVQEVVNSGGQLQWASAAAPAVPVATPDTAPQLALSATERTSKAAASHYWVTLVFFLLLF